MYILGWTEGQITQAILEQAAANGDMTRAGIVAAANEVEVDFDGLAPDQTWAGEPNDFLVRESYIYDVDARRVQPGHRSARAAAAPAGSCSRVRTPASVAADYDFDGPCFEPAERTP